MIKQETRVKREREIQKRLDEEEIISDQFDLFSLATRVHSDISSMSKDYTLANYNSQILNAKLPKYIREQRKALRIIKTYLEIPIERLEKRYDKEEAKLILKQLQETFKRIERLLIGELDEIVIMTRAEGGKVINAILQHGLLGRDTEELDDMINNRKEEEGNKLLKEKKVK